jgi:hypothetical protein
MAMWEPHARQGRQAWMRSSQIANVRQKETREIETMPRRGEDNPRERRKNSDCGGHAGAMMMPAFEIFLVPWRWGITSNSWPRLIFW